MSNSSQNNVPNPGQRGESRLRDSIASLIHRVRQCMDDAFASEVGGIDLTPRQLVVLEAVSVSPGASQTQLCETTGIDRSTLADIMRRLVQKRVVVRRRSGQDARAYFIELTEAGHGMLRQTVPVAARVEQRITEVLGSRRRDELRDTLEMIVHGLRR